MVPEWMVIRWGLSLCTLFPSKVGSLCSSVMLMLECCVETSLFIPFPAIFSILEGLNLSITLIDFEEASRNYNSVFFFKKIVRCLLHHLIITIKKIQHILILCSHILTNIFVFCVLILKSANSSIFLIKTSIPFEGPCNIKTKQ